jgi:hypothetical protein
LASIHGKFHGRHFSCTAQSREGFFYGLQQLLNAPQFNPADFIALNHKYDSFPVDTGS